VSWLEVLVRPEQVWLARLRAAIAIASEQKPRVINGDLRTNVAALVREALKGSERSKSFHAAASAICHYTHASLAQSLLDQEARQLPRLAPVRLRYHLLASCPTGIGF
jgi:hypothetical protein